MTKDVLDSVKYRLDYMNSEPEDGHCLFTDEVRRNIDNGLIHYWLVYKPNYDDYELYYEEEDRWEVEIDRFLIDIRRDLISMGFDENTVDEFGKELSDYIYSLTTVQ